MDPQGSREGSSVGVGTSCGGMPKIGPKTNRGGGVGKTTCLLYVSNGRGGLGNAVASREGLELGETKTWWWVGIDYWRWRRGWQEVWLFNG